MGERLIPIPGTRLKFRTEERDGRPTATATIWLEDRPIGEVATLDLTLIERPGDPAYQAWVDAVASAFAGFLNRQTGQMAITTKRQKPRYRGE